jgi:ribosome-associated protein
MEDILIGQGIVIRAEELRFTVSRSSGPGGQNVNKVNTRARLWFDLGNSPSLDDAARARISAALGPRIGRDGAVALSSGRYRSLEANRHDCAARFRELLRKALIPPKKRVPTKPPPSAGKKRLEGKRRLKRRKAMRGRVEDLDE